MSNHITLTQWPNTTPLPIYPAQPPWFSVVAPILQFIPQPHHVTASPPIPGDNPPEHGRTVRKNAWHAKISALKTQSCSYTPDSPVLPILLADSTLSLCGPRPSSRRPSNLTTYIRNQYPSSHTAHTGTHPFFQRAQTILILSGPLDSPTPFL